MCVLRSSYRAELGYRAPGDVIIAVRYGVAVIGRHERCHDRRVHSSMIVATETLARYVRHGTEA
jgi:hypothetical protein